MKQACGGENAAFVNFTKSSDAFASLFTLAGCYGYDVV
jgi:hypothetical protein